MTLLIPQIPSEVAEALLSALALARPEDLDPGDEFRYSQSITQPTGGLPISDVLLKQLREPIVTSARKHGFPFSRPSSFLDFELEVASRHEQGVLTLRMPFPPQRSFRYR